MEVTLIDYGLSRAKIDNGDVIYNNLETDLAIFHSEESGIAGIQFDTYRRLMSLSIQDIESMLTRVHYRMRTHLITGTHSMNKKDWHDKHSMPATISEPWKDFLPYTNVLWIRYVLAYLLKAYKKSGGNKNDLNEFTVDTKELNKRLNFKTKVENGAFTSAHDVLAYVVSMGWVSEEQLENYGVDESILGEVSELIDDGEGEEDGEEDE
jgi:serine/threonine-protein kinase haspin